MINNNSYKTRATALLVLSIFIPTLQIAVEQAVSESSKKSFKGDLNYKGFLDNLKLYKTTYQFWHAGDLYEHSVWTAKQVEKWFDEKHFWADGLTENDRPIAVLAAFLHDIGKAGDFAYLYDDKPAHPRAGVEYVLGKRPYLFRPEDSPPKEQRKFDFKEYFKQLGLSDDDHKLLAVLVGVHWDFGGIVLRGINTAGAPVDKEKTKEDVVCPFFLDLDSSVKQHGAKETTDLSCAYLLNLEKLAKETGYNNGIIDKRLLLLSMIIAAADVRASQPVNYRSETLPELTDVPATHPGFDPYTRFSIEEKGKIGKQNVLKYFDSDYAPSKKVEAVRTTTVRQAPPKILHNAHQGITTA